MSLLTFTHAPAARSRRRRKPASGRARALAALGGAALLASVALPVYTAHSPEHRRSDAQDALTESAVLLEEYFSRHQTYTPVFGAAGIRREPTAGGGAYDLAVLPATDECPIERCYVLAAIPRGAQARDACGTLTVRSSGAAGPAGCW